MSRYIPRANLYAGAENAVVNYDPEDDPREPRSRREQDAWMRKRIRPDLELAVPRGTRYIAEDYGGSIVLRREAPEDGVAALLADTDGFQVQVLDPAGSPTGRIDW